MSRGQNVLDIVHAPTIATDPLSIDVNGDLWRIAAGYMTLGLTARVAAEFATRASRQSMRAAPTITSVTRRIGQAATGYRAYSQYRLPAFRVNGELINRSSTDIAVANTPIVAGMIRPTESYYDTDYFGARSDLDMANVFEAASFGIQSLIGRSPLKRMHRLHIAFDDAATIPAQTDGEYTELTDVRDMVVYKQPETMVRVLHAKGLLPRSRNQSHE